MPQLFIILLKINLVLILFAGAYFFVLRKLTFYTANRVFLLFGVAFSSAYPFISISGLSDRYQTVAAAIPQISENISNYVRGDSSAFYWQIIAMLFWSGVAAMTIRLTLQFVSLYRIHQASDPGQVAGYPVRILHENLGPFSFWQTIYINPDLHTEKDLHNILKHERVHVQDLHTIDIVLAEISLVFYWFNPGIWWIKKAIRENIEFITDARILKKGIDKKDYQYSLLHAGQLQPAISVVNNFSLVDLKKRIIMMNARRSSRLAISRYLFLLPVLLVTTLAFTLSRNKPEPAKQPKLAAVITKSASQSQPPVSSQKIKQKKQNIKQLVSPTVPTDTTRSVIFVQAFDVNPDSVSTGLDVLPEPYPGNRIKMITVRRRIPGDATSGNTFVVERDVDKTPASVFMNFGKTERLRESSDKHTVAKFFYNGKEVSREEFKSLNIMDENGAKPGKKLMIHIRKEGK